MNPSPSNNNNFASYKPFMTFALPSSCSVPTHFNSIGIPFENVGKLLTNLNIAIAGTINYLATEATWANDTNSALEKLDVSITPLISALLPIKLNPSEITENPTARFGNYNSYFQIIEYSNMDVLQLLKEDVNLLSSILTEMRIIRMDEQELINFLKGAVIRIETYLEILGVEAKGENFPAQDFHASVIDPLVFDCRISSTFFRWFACHWDFAINLIHARYHFDVAANLFAKNDFQGTTKAIIKASVLLRATSADMVFGCAMPAKIYQEYIRPSMGEGFTGNDNVHWAIFAASKKALLAKPGIKNDQIINSAWSFFLEKYLQDIEVHTTIADKLVGGKPSLTIDELNQGIPEEEQDKTPATAGLRNLHYMRLAEFDFLHSYPIINTLFKQK